jgi:GNAT superfamily N-acetyltransferase
VIAVALNGIQHPGDIVAAQAKLQTMADMKFRQIFDLLYGVNKSLDLFTQHGVDRIFECRILSVDKQFRSRGLARELLRRSEIIARESGFKVLSTERCHKVIYRFCKFYETKMECCTAGPSLCVAVYRCLRRMRQVYSHSAWQRVWDYRLFIRSGTPTTRQRALVK